MTGGLPRSRTWRDARYSDLVGKLFLSTGAGLRIGPGKIL